MFRSTLAIALLAAQVASAVDAPPAAPADTILRNGRMLVFSGVERHQRAEAPRFEQAIAIRDGRIVYVGTNEQAGNLAGPNTQVTDLQGRMVMPGIVDGHFHGTRMTDCAMGYDGGTIPQILAKLQACLDRPDQAVHKGTNVALYASQFFGDAILPSGTPLTGPFVSPLVPATFAIRQPLLLTLDKSCAILLSSLDRRSHVPIPHRLDVRRRLRRYRIRL